MKEKMQTENQNADRMQEKMQRWLWNRQQKGVQNRSQNRLQNRLQQKSRNPGRIPVILAGTLTVLLLVGCGSVSEEEGEDMSAVLRGKYQEYLNELVESHVFPNGVEADVSLMEGDDFSQNTFAICDVDGDGAEELLISFEDTTMAGMVLYIFQYDADEDTCREELSEFPGVTFYEDGYLTAAMSHNQGLAGEFWPYSIYSYDADSDTYLRVATIDAWEKESFPTDFSGAAYPDEIDVSGSGYVYYIYEDEVYAEDTVPVDVTVYEKLLEDTYGGKAEVEFNWMALTQENIEEISE